MTDRTAVALVAVGGFAGAATRHLVALALAAPSPWGTLGVNVLGAFLLGVLTFRAGTGRRTRLLVGSGLLSSFTTYSTFAAEATALATPAAAANVLATYLLGFGAVVLARRLVGDDR
jgi:CrcB protein